MDVKTGSKRLCPSPVTLGSKAKIPRMLPYEEATEGNNSYGPYDETLWPMDCDGVGDLVEDGSDSQQHDYSVLTESQANEAVSKTSATPITEPMEACRNYDTCFGVMIVAPSSSHVGKVGARSMSVRLQPLGNSSIMLYDEFSGAHVGSIHNPKLVHALFQLPLRLDAMLLVSEADDIKEKGKLKKREQGATKSTQDLIRIVLHGLQHTKEAIGNNLSEAGIFLQHPSAAEVMPEARYDNPHYLARPGVGMPKLERFYQDERVSQDSMRDSTEAELTDDIRGGRLRRIFETAVADGGSVTVMSVAPSPRLRTPLMRHQVLAVAMMQEKESGFVEEPMFPSLWRKEFAQNGNSVYYRHKITRSLEPKPMPALGGILADDMGLGKTLSMLALICASLDFNSTTEGQNIGGESQGTLIVAPKSTINGWVTQAERHIHAGKIRIMVYHGSNRKSLANQFQDPDIVITTYETIRAEWAAKDGAGALFSRKWLRVVLDEGNSPHSQSFEPDFPIHDYGALLSFVRVFPFLQKSNFTSWIVKPIEDEHPLGVGRLQELIRATCLRRMKDKVFSSNEIKLPPRSEQIHEVHLHQDDRNLYDAIKTVCAETAAGLAERPGKSPSPEGKEKNLMVLINSLRLICDHGEQLLPKTMKSRIGGTLTLSSDSGIEQIRSGSYSTRDAQAYNYAAWGLEHQMSMEEGSQITDSHSNLGDGIDNSVVVFSYWVKMLDLVEQALRKENFIFQRIDGQTSLEGRRVAMRDFQGDPSCTVMVDLTAASVVHLLEPHWNPMVEAQAVDRVYRMGQTQEVTVIRYIVPNSIETYVQRVQQEKLQLVNHAINVDRGTEAELEAERWKV
ncbi:P-loop containing nucleoside triphosphate hydrolase protein [Xylaria grammica]|nr:P-loop containing nucleoside triphosphate hydrolase protein [Xylaria grammica]